MQSLKVLNEYPNSHHYWETYTKTNLHCPNCGQKELWEASSADYYIGSLSICTNCGHSCYLVNGPSEITAPNKLTQLEQLRKQQTYTPTTKKGG